MTDFYIRDPQKMCPSCRSEGHLGYVTVPPSLRAFTAADGEQYWSQFDETKDYSCRNCGCEFILVRAE